MTLVCATMDLNDQFAMTANITDMVRLDFSINTRH